MIDIILLEKKLKQFFSDYWEIKNDEYHKIFLHSRIMSEMLIKTIKDTDLEKDYHIFLISAWIHDMGRSKSKIDHEKLSLIFLDNFITENNIKLLNKHRDLIEECIIEHRSTGNPLNIHSKLFQMIDKLSLHTNEWLEYKKRSSKT